MIFVHHLYLLFKTLNSAPTFTALDIYELKGVHFLFHAPCVYRYNREEKIVSRKMYSLALAY